jgi:hypothetical protein
MDAFAALEPVADDYAHLPVAEAFTWAPVAEALAPGEWYMVAFRSILRRDADEEQLRRYDDWAHEEASGAPGFVHYYKGPLAADRSCLSFCFWTSRAEARAAAGRPAHREAVGLIAETYEEYTLEFLRVRKRDGASSLDFEPFDAASAHEPAPAPLSPQLGFNPAPS